MKNIVFIGAGRIATAISYALKEKDACTAFWDKQPGKVADQKELEEIVPSGDIIFFCVPSWGLREAIMLAAPYIRRDAIVISPSKGIESANHKTTDELFKELLPAGISFALLSGPMLADEICKGNFAAAVVATESRATYEAIAPLFADTNLHIEYSSDVHGAALGGIFKNVYALSLGMAEGLGWGSNEKGIMVTKAIAEMQEIFKLLGGKPETVLTVAGLGDFIATGFSPCSKNYTAGLEIARDGAATTQSEGLASFESVASILGNNVSNFKLLSAIKRIVIEKVPATDALADWARNC